MSNINNKSFTRALLNEISHTGSSTKKIFDHSIANLTSTIVLNNTSYVASLMIDIMDRNLYERANDCRWWALTDEFKDILSTDNINSENKGRLKSILQYINNLYTVYTNLFIYDKNGTIQACSNENENFIIGKQVNEEIVAKTKSLKNSNNYHVSNFEPSKFYDDKHTYIYHAKISNDDEFLGGIGIVFNSTQEFEMMLKESLPKFDKENDDMIFGVYADRDKNIISTSNSKLQIGQILDISDKFFTLKNGESYSEIIIYEGNYYALGVKCSQGYREYKKSDNYENDVFALYFSYISSANILVKKDIELEEQIPLENHENTKEIATFYIGGKWLGVDINDVFEAVNIEKLDKNLSVDDEHYFKGTIIYKNKAVVVLDIKNFIDEDNSQKYEEIIIIKNYENSDNYIGILVNNLGEIPEIKEEKIKKIDSHILGSSTLINSVVIPENGSKRNKILSILDFKRLKENLIEKNRG